MSEITNLLVETTDPITALLLLGILYYVRRIRIDIEKEIQRNRGRIERLEEGHMNP